MKVEGGGHYLRAVNDGAGTVDIVEYCEIRLDIVEYCDILWNDVEYR